MNRRAAAPKAAFLSLSFHRRRSSIAPPTRPTHPRRATLIPPLRPLDHRNVQKTPIDNALTEGFNTTIQALKASAKGYLNFENFRIAILFFCGKLDMRPDFVRVGAPC